MNRNAELYYESALKCMLPVSVLPEVDGFAITLARQRYFFRGMVTPLNNSASSSVLQNKYCTNKLLENAGIPVPKAEAISVDEFREGKLEAMIAHLPFPLVVKPMQDSSFGDDVLCNIQTMDTLIDALNERFARHAFLLIEAFHGGLQSYRVLVLGNKIIGVMHRQPAHVIGDGEQAILNLIEETNARRVLIADTLAPIVVDEECNICLKEQGLQLTDIPQKGERVWLGYTSNASRGGIYESLGTRICKENKQLMRRVGRTLNLKIMGIDIQCEDIMKPITPSTGVIIEVNRNPSIRIHHEPLKGEPIAVGAMVIRRLIYRHPISYIYSLLNDTRINVIIRAILVVLFVTLVLFFVL